MVLYKFCNGPSIILLNPPTKDRYTAAGNLAEYHPTPTNTCVRVVRSEGKMSSKE